MNQKRKLLFRYLIQYITKGQLNINHIMIFLEA